MADKTGISWTDHTFNPWWGCTKVSPACTNCYAETMSLRWGHDIWGLRKPRRELSEDNWKKPFKWNEAAKKTGKRHRVFCGSMCDWAEDHDQLSELRKSLWNVIRATPNLDWLMLTKRAENILKMLPADWSNGWQHVWLGTTIESNEWVWRADELRAVPAAIRFISYEPALGPLDKLTLEGLHWIIYGGESATKKKLRRDEDQWARDTKARCEEAGMRFFYKQNSATPGKHIEQLDGEIYHDWPRSRIPLVVVY